MLFKLPVYILFDLTNIIGLHYYLCCSTFSFHSVFYWICFPLRGHPYLQAYILPAARCTFHAFPTTLGALLLPKHYLASDFSRNLAHQPSSVLSELCHHLSTHNCSYQSQSSFLGLRLMYFNTLSYLLPHSSMH